MADSEEEQEQADDVASELFTILVDTPKCFDGKATFAVIIKSSRAILNDTLKMRELIS